MSQGNFIRPEYGDYFTQQRERLELCGLEDPADRYDSPQGPPLRFCEPFPEYPLDKMGAR